jgi:hypothetical protein
MASNDRAERSSENHMPGMPIESFGQISKTQEVYNPSDGSSTVPIGSVQSTSQHIAGSYRGSVSPVTSRARLSVDIAPLGYGDLQAVDHVGTLEAQEDHAFLSEASHTGTSVTPIARNKIKRKSPALLKTWWFELASLTVAMAALIAIAITLAEYNNKEQPTWKFSLNLNTLIAILATLLRACMVVVAEEGEAYLACSNYSLTYSSHQPAEVALVSPATTSPTPSALRFSRPRTMGFIVTLVSDEIAVRILAILIKC